MHLRTSVVVRPRTFRWALLAVAALLVMPAPASATPLVGPIYPLPFNGVTLHGGPVLGVDRGEHALALGGTLLRATTHAAPPPAPDTGRSTPSSPDTSAQR